VKGMTASGPGKEEGEDSKQQRSRSGNGGMMVAENAMSSSNSPQQSLQVARNTNTAHSSTNKEPVASKQALLGRKKKLKVRVTTTVSSATTHYISPRDIDRRTAPSSSGTVTPTSSPKLRLCNPCPNVTRRNDRIPKV